MLLGVYSQVEASLDISSTKDTSEHLVQEVRGRSKNT